MLWWKQNRFIERLCWIGWSSTTSEISYRSSTAITIICLSVDKTNLSSKALLVGGWSSYCEWSYLLLTRITLASGGSIFLFAFVPRYLPQECRSLPRAVREYMRARSFTRRCSFRIGVRGKFEDHYIKFSLTFVFAWRKFLGKGSNWNNRFTLKQEIRHDHAHLLLARKNGRHDLIHAAPRLRRGASHLLPIVLWMGRCTSDYRLNPCFCASFWFVIDFSGFVSLRPHGTGPGENVSRVAWVILSFGCLWGDVVHKDARCGGNIRVIQNPAVIRIVLIKTLHSITVAHWIVAVFSRKCPLSL